MLRSRSLSSSRLQHAHHHRAMALTKLKVSAAKAKLSRRATMALAMGFSGENQHGHVWHMGSISNRLGIIADAQTALPRIGHRASPRALHINGVSAPRFMDMPPCCSMLAKAKAKAMWTKSSAWLSVKHQPAPADRHYQPNPHCRAAPYTIRY